MNGDSRIWKGDDRGDTRWHAVVRLGRGVDEIEAAELCEKLTRMVDERVIFSVMEIGDEGGRHVVGIDEGTREGDSGWTRWSNGAVVCFCCRETWWRKHAAPDAEKPLVESNLPRAELLAITLACALCGRLSRAIEMENA